MGRRGRDMVSPKNIPMVQQPTIRIDITKQSYYLRSKRSVPHIRELGNRTKEMSPQYIWL